MRRSVLRAGLAIAAMLVALAVPLPAGAADGYLTSAPPKLVLDPSAPAGSSLLAIISSGERPPGGPVFEGIPDGIGAMSGSRAGTVDVFVNHEQSHVPFPPNLADFKDSSVTRLTLDAGTGAVLSAGVAIGPRKGYMRFCSSTMAGPAQGLDRLLYLTGEETNDIVPVPAGAPYGPDPSVAPNRQGGYAVALNPATGRSRPIPGMGRLNHENAMVVPGGWDDVAVVTGDDTFSAPSSQLYLYLAGSTNDLWKDRGRLWAFRVTRTEAGKVDPADPFNGANDYGDIARGDRWQGRFIKVPRAVALGNTAKPPQTALEDWSNEHNVFQFIRVEDTAYDPGHPRTVFIADTGSSGAVPDPATGRLTGGGSGTFVNGRIFTMKFSRHDPRKVTSFRVLLDADAGKPAGASAPMHQPDNMGTSSGSLMVQEDSGQAPPSRVWRYDLGSKTWSVVASTKDQSWESSGIVDASDWFGPGTWLLDVQAHDVFVDTKPGPPGVTLKREAGQLLLMTIPGS
jgi:Bacterial protein of unknown function (DUF839)